MEKNRFAMTKRGTAAVLAILVGLAYPISVSAQEPAAGSVDFSEADPAVDSPGGFERNPLLSAVHLGLGWAAFGTGLAAGILNPGVAGDDVHGALGIASSGLSAATLAFGFLAHYGEVGPKFKLSANNVHAVMGIAGGVLMMVAPFIADSDAHPFVGAAGVGLMGLSIAWKIVI